MVWIETFGTIHERIHRPLIQRRMTMEHYQDELLERQEFEFEDEGDDAYEL